MISTTLAVLAQAAVDVGGHAAQEAPTVKLDLVGLFQNAAWPIKATIALLVGCSLLVWMISVLKMLQLGRLQMIQQDFDRRVRNATSPAELYEASQSRRSPGARVVAQLFTRAPGGA